LCLAVLCSVFLGAADSNAATAAGSAPDIKVFSADPMTLPDGGSATYQFEVVGATYMQLTEAGAVLREINSPPFTSIKGNAKGQTTNEIRTGDMNTFDAILIARNSAGERKKSLTLSFASKIQPLSTDNKTKARTPKWGPTSITPLTLTPSATRNLPAPQFTSCTEKCNYCLKPDEAAARGFTDKCSEALCYYSPDNQQKWYCYSKPPTVWCCANGRVLEMTKAQCTQAGGTGFNTQSEAQQACLGWCCKDQKVGQTTQTQCAQLGGYWYETQSQAIQACQQMAMGYCCRDGQIGSTTQSQCAQLGGTWYTTLSQAQAACQRTVYWCCSNGQVFQTYSYTAGCYKTREEAEQACQSTCWCCSGGKVYQTTQAACSRAGGACYSSQSQAAANCRYQTPLLK